jgi:hypothetical protein
LDSEHQDLLFEQVPVGDAEAVAALAVLFVCEIVDEGHRLDQVSADVPAKSKPHF